MLKKIFPLIIIISITTIVVSIYILMNKNPKEENNPKIKSTYTIEVQESKNIPTEIIGIGFLDGKKCFIMNLDNIIYKTKSKRVFIMEPLNEGYLTIEMLKLQMNKEESSYGELYRYDGKGNIGTSRFSIYITDDSILFANYDYKLNETNE